MAKNRRDYIFTHHLRRRFLQRTDKKFTHLDQCRSPDCETCQQQTDEILQDLAANGRQINSEIANRLDQAEENRSYLNNTGFMSWYYDKYGYDKRFEFLIHEDILFVVVWDNGKKIVVTCVPSKTHLVGRTHFARKKFNKVAKKEAKLL